MPHKDQETRLAYHRAYHETHREEQLAQRRAHYAAHRETYQQRMAAYYATHKSAWPTYRERYRKKYPDRIRTSRIAYYWRNYAQILAYREGHRVAKRLYMVVYHATHRELARARGRRYRARKYSAPINDFTAAQWQEMQTAFDHRCAYCGKRAKGRLTQDHITPLSSGGSHTASNIVPSCRPCNSKKSTKAPLTPVQPLLLTIAAAKSKKVRQKSAE